MSSRAFRRLQQDAEVIRIRGVPGEGDQEDEQETPGFGSQSGGRRKKAGNNLFALLGEDDGDGSPSDQEEDQENGDAAATKPLATQSSKKAKRKKKKKKTKSTDEGVDKPEEGTDDVDTAIKEVNELLGEIPAGDQSVGGAAMATLHRSLLTIDRRFLNADNEMRRIFGSRVVHAEQGRRRTHQKTYHRPTVLATPKDSWPKMDKPGLSMQLAECKDGCQCFVFEHSVTYQRIQFRFWDAVETFDPNAIGAVLHAHPYHIDSLLQLSEVCKMSEDVQMAADLIERALYCFECTFHALFNYTQGNCRLSFSRAENRPFFLALFRHLYYIGRRGCHRTALEFCKFLLSLDPEGDPLCVLLMMDYYALRAGEYHFILNLFREWESHRNLSQLPNFAFSVPLALFHSSQCEGERGDEKLQEALIMFPSLLHPLLDKCSVTVDPAVMKHTFFNHTLSRDPEALQLLIKLYIERSHSLWKEPEVLTWLEANARRVIARADSRDPLIDDCVKKRQKRYIGTPRNIYRHVIISDIEQAVAALPRELANSPIMMYDPLPPLDSIAGYNRPERTHTGLREDENPLILFLRSLLPNFNPQGEGPGDLRQRRQMVRPPPQEEGGPEGAVGGPMNLQPMLERLSDALQGLIDELRPPGHQEGEGESSDEENG